MEQRVMVVGGSGNISTAVVRRLLEDGYRVSIFTRGTSALDVPKEVEMVTGDRRDEAASIDIMRKGNYDYAIDMICMDPQAAAVDIQAFPEVKRMVFCSSGAAYGGLLGSEQPIREDFKCGPMNWSYGISKRAAENVFMGAYYKTGYPVTIIRPTVTYGRQKVLNRQIGSDNVWIDRIRKGKPIVTGNPYLLRNFLHADDAAGAFAGALRHDCCIGQSYNMVGPKPYDWGTYHTAMMHVLGRQVEMVEVTLDTLLHMQTKDFTVGEMITENFKYNGFYSGEKIARDIPEFCPRIGLEQGLAMALEFIERHGEIPNSDDYPYEDEIIRRQKSIW